VTHPLCPRNQGYPALTRYSHVFTYNTSSIHQHYTTTLYHHSKYTIMIMTTSPMVAHSTPPTGNSPSLRASGVKGNMTPMSLPAASPVSQYQQPNSAPRSYARAPPIRPYASPSLRRTNAKDAEGDTKKFGELVAQLVEDRSRRHRKGDDLQMDGIEEGVKQGAEGSLSGSWEKERAELIVDVPVWSPGCFQGTSFDCRDGCVTDPQTCRHCTL
jgi:hypothetical protein